MDDPVPSTSSTSKKRKKESAPNEDDPQPKRTQPDSNSKTDIVASSAGLKNSLHGNIFQLKLLNLFLLQGLDAGYDFLLATERPDLGDKFDDLVFKFWPNTSKRSEFKIRFVQVKHKQSDSETIKASHLLNTTEGDFSLVKYFLSFRHIHKKYSNNLHDVVICSNAGLDEESLNSKGFSLIPHPNSDEDKIFTFGTLHHLQLQNHSTSNPHELCVKLKECSTIHLLANDIIKCFSNKTKMTLQNPWFKLYHFALIEERALVVDAVTHEAKFHVDFKKNRRNLSPRALALRKILVKVAKCQTSKTFGNETPEAYTSLPCDHVTDYEIDEFFKKLVFAKVPNEVELGKILTASVGKRYGLNNSSLQSAFILTEILNWFKTKESKFMSAKEGLDILKKNEEKIKALQYTWSSLHYQEIVTEDGFSFSPVAIQQTVARLKTFLDSSDEDLLQIFTLSCRLSCIKLHFALRCFSEFQPRDSYWMLQYSDLKTKRNLTLLKDTMKSTDSPKLLIIVCDDTVPPPYLKASDVVQQKQQKMILLVEGEAISEGVSEKKVKVRKDEINFRDLNEESQTLLLNVSVNFQGEKNLLNVKTLIQSDDPSQVIDSISLLQLYLNRTKGIDVGAAPPVSSQYDESLYIDRRLVSPFPLEEFESHIRGAFGFGEMFKLSDKGNIEWMTENYEERAVCWKGMKGSIVGNENNPASQKYTITESELLNKWGNSKVVIVSDIPGIGKSDLLTHLYRLIKKARPYDWVVRLNFLDCFNLFDLNGNLDNVISAVDFLTNNLIPSLKTDHFSNSLFRHRLLNKTTGGLILMFDGFDEMKDCYQNNAARLINMLLQTKIDRIFVTTRPHMKENLEDNFFHFAYEIEDFNQEDQENFLTNYWVNKLKNDERRIREFAESIVELAMKKLDDKGRVFSGIPLHCRMLAECFQDHLKTGLLAEGAYITIPIHLDGEPFDIANLFQLYWKTKCKILQSEKRKIDSNNVFNSAAEQAESIIPRQFFQKLAIHTLFDEKNANILWDKSQFQSILQQYSDLSFVHGLTEKNGDLQRFPHLMSAEYFVADYVICTFEDGERRDSLDKHPVQDLILKVILNERFFKGVRSFLDCRIRATIPCPNVSWPFPSSSLLLTHQKFNDRLASFSQEETETFSVDQILFLITKEGNANILGWLLYCAKESFFRQSRIPDRCWTVEMEKFLCPRKVCLALKSAFNDNVGYIFERFLLWFEDSKDPSVLIKVIDCILIALSEQNIHFRSLHPSRASELKIFLDFIKRHRGILGSSYLNKLSQEEPFILTSLLWSYGANVPDLIGAQICKQVLRSLSDIFEKQIMTKIMEKWFGVSYKSRPLNFVRTYDRMRETSVCPVFDDFPYLVVMQGIIFVHKTFQLELECHDQLNSLITPIFVRALKLDPLTLLRLEPETLNGTSICFKPLIGRYGLSQLQIAAMYDNVQTIEQVLCSAHCESKKEELARELTENEFGIPPLYLAARCCHQKACLVILEFLKSIPPSYQVLDSVICIPRCLFQAVVDSTNYSPLSAERVIVLLLNAVEKFYGREVLLQLLMWRIVPMSQFENCLITIFSLSVNNEMFDVISKIVDIFPENLTEIILNEKNNFVIALLSRPSPIEEHYKTTSVNIPKLTEDMMRIETQRNCCLLKILEHFLSQKKEKGLLEFLLKEGNLTSSVDRIVSIYSNEIVTQFTITKLFPSLLFDFVDIVTLKRRIGSRFTSVWSEYCTQPGTCVKFIDHILNCMYEYKEHGEEIRSRVEGMIFHNDGKGPVIELAKKWGRDDVVDVMSKHMAKINPTLLKDINERIANIIPFKNPAHAMLQRDFHV
ncbi:hypothetical protein DAPPUDRAFT_313131 [Daphnia pulex]|uniref:NACHT domain-containing protein n=1 Tax=Daphnia pulex TaxID=6669 RepID=E9G2X3_DAPPU|nr:hypothetical protein DAPPUDRAFT_313131 [Daphnia pulex]|eukprot:EFX86430.1 hypothetical protein DAPPUDRAFT_313131 [Daphnia pulex]